MNENWLIVQRACRTTCKTWATKLVCNVIQDVFPPTVDEIKSEFRLIIMVFHIVCNDV